MWLITLLATTPVALAQQPPPSPALAPSAWFRSFRLAKDPPAIPADAYRRAKNGDIVAGLQPVEGSRIRKAWGVAVLPVDIGSLWAAINDNASKTRISRLNHVEILSGAPCGPERVVFQSLDVRFFTDRWWVVRQRQNVTLNQATLGQARELVWNQVDDDPLPLSDAARRLTKGTVRLPFTEGAWLLVALDADRTLLEYSSWSHPGAGIPAGLASRLATGGIVDTIESMARLARSGPSCPTR